MLTTYIILGILALIIIWAIASYNGFVTFITRAKEAWSDIDVQMKRRYDLIPNLVNVVKGYAAHESGVFEKVTEARSKAMQAGSIEEKAAAEGELTSTLKSLFAISEAYPDLKANMNFLELQRELSDSENKIQAARRFYNSNVADLNAATQKFPSNIIAKAFHFDQMEFFELADSEAAAKQPVEVKF